MSYMSNPVLRVRFSLEAFFFAVSSSRRCSYHPREYRGSRCPAFQTFFLGPRGQDRFLGYLLVPETRHVRQEQQLAGCNRTKKGAEEGAAGQGQLVDCAFHRHRLT